MSKSSAVSTAWRRLRRAPTLPELPEALGRHRPVDAPAHALQVPPSCLLIVGPAVPVVGRPEVEARHLGFRHLTHGEADPLAAEARAFDAAEGHGVYAVVAAVVHHPAVVQPAYGAEGRVEVARKHAGLQTGVNPLAREIASSSEPRRVRTV